MPRISITLMLAFSACFAQTPDAVKPPADATRQVNDRARQEMHLNDERDFAEARRGRIAQLPDGGVVRNAAGNILVDAGSFGFVTSGARAPDSVNPSLWRQSQLMSETGLFQVTDPILYGPLKPVDRSIAVAQLTPEQTAAQVSAALHE